MGSKKLYIKQDAPIFCYCSENCYFFDQKTKQQYVRIAKSRAAAFSAPVFHTKTVPALFHSRFA